MAIYTGEKFPPYFYWTKKYGGESPLVDFIPGYVKDFYATL